MRQILASVVSIRETPSQKARLMRKILSLLLVPIFLLVLFLLSPTQVSSAHCTFTSVTASISPGGTIEVRGIGPSGHFFVPEIVNSNTGNSVDPGGSAGGQADSNGQIYFTFSAPTTLADYDVGLLDNGSFGGGGFNHACTGSGPLNVDPSNSSVTEPNAPAELGAIVLVIRNIIKLLVPIAAIAFFIMMIIGGAQFIFSGGDPKAAAGARSTLTYAIIGIILVVVSWLILLLVQNVTGVDVTNVVFPTLP